MFISLRDQDGERDHFSVQAQGIDEDTGMDNAADTQRRFGLVGVSECSYLANDVHDRLSLALVSLALCSTVVTKHGQACSIVGTMHEMLLAVSAAG